MLPLNNVNCITKIHICAYNCCDIGSISGNISQNVIMTAGYGSIYGMSVTDFINIIYTFLSFLIW